MKHALNNNLMTMGWYMRRTADSHALGDFYRHIVGLPVLRGGRPWPVTMFWAGEAIVFELKSDEEPMPARDQDPASAPCTPVFRVHDLDGLVSRLTGLGVDLIGEETLEQGRRQAHMLDTDGQIMTFRETPRGSTNAIDVEAWRRFDSPSDFDPECGDMPSHIQMIDGIVMRVADLSGMRDFYSDIIGFSVVEEDDGMVMFDLGDCTFLELRPGGQEVAVPNDRVEITNSFILRLQDTEKFKKYVKERGVHFVNEHVQWKRAHLAYFADPEGRIVGIEQRYDPNDYLEPVEVYAEDVESERRFADGRRTLAGDS